MRIVALIILLCSSTISFSQKCNCCDSIHSQFDFWIGEWEVFDTSGTLVGHNIIKATTGHCVLQENWTGAKGFVGTSYNYFDPADNKWHQRWIDASGNVLNLEGGLKGNEMVLQSGPDAPSINRITWTPNEDGSVRQHWQVSKDRGKSWSTLFDGEYRSPSK